MLSLLLGTGLLSSDSSGDRRHEVRAAVEACGSDLPRLQRGMAWEVHFHTSRKNEALSGELTSKMGGSFSDLGSGWLGRTWRLTVLPRG